MWKSVYIDFKDNTEFLKIMQMLDYNTYKKIEIELSINNNKAFKLLAAGSFWILLFIIVIGSIAVIANNIPLITLAVILIFVCIFIIVIGAFVLKSTDSLSEDGFLKLISIVCENQIKVLKILNRNNKNK